MTTRLKCLCLLVTLSTLLCSCLGPGGTVRVSGDLNGRLVWSGRIEIAGDVVLAADSELIIRPGTEVVFLPAEPNLDRWRDHPNFPGSELIVHGRIEALGTAEQPIVFRAAAADAEAGAWGGVNLVESPDADFAYCYFTQADSALHSWQSKVFVQQCRFERNLVGIRFNDSPILIERNTLISNGTGIRFHYGAPVICRNEIRDNERGLFITSYPRDYLIENNRIIANRHANVVLGEEVPEDVLMPGNDWGSSDVATIAATFFDGQRDPWIGRIRFEPVRELSADAAGAQWNR